MSYGPFTPPMWGWGYPPPPHNSGLTLQDVTAARAFWKEVEDEFKKKEKEDKDKKKPKRGSFEWSVEKRYNIWHLTFWLVILSPLMGPAVTKWVTEVAPALFK